MFPMELFGQIIGATSEHGLLVFWAEELRRIVVGLEGLVVGWRQGVMGMEENDADQKRDEGDAAEDVDEEKP